MGHDGEVGVRVLGVAALARGDEVIEIASPRQRAILATLAAADGKPVTVDALIDVLWGEQLPASPSAALQTQLSRLRELLGGDAPALRKEPGGYALAMDRGRIDAWTFAALVSEAAACGPNRRADLLAEALAMWRGPAFADVADRPAVRPVAVRLEELALRAREDRAEALLATGATGEALARLEALAADDPLRERALALLMRGLYLAGRHGEALERYHQHRRLLASELGLLPSPMLAELERAILSHELEPHSSAPDLTVTGAPPTKNGTVATETSAVTGDAAATAAAPRRPRPGKMPPPPVSELVGRRAERAAVAERLGAARILTITGPGGVGKTRLALHAAHDMSDRYPDGVWWCDLASVMTGDDSTDVATAVAAVLGVEDRAGGTLADRLVTVLATRRALVVLDNCEHVLSPTADLVDRLVRSAETVDVLLTSREPLAIDGEHRLRLEPLAVPTGEEITDAVILFLQRVRAVNAEATTDGRAWDAVLEICRTLDGLPLALEFAAARVAHMTLADVAGQLDHRFDLLGPAGRRRHDPRHASLATTLEWSYELLDDGEKAVLDALALFAGTFTLDDGQRLCAAHDRSDARAVAQALASLVDKSLVAVRDHAGAARYHLLESVRAYSLERLASTGDIDEWRRRHAVFTIELASRAGAAVRGPAEREWHPVLDEHIGDLRAARASLLADGDLDGVVRLCASLAWFADIRSRPELDRWATEAIRRAGRELPAHPCLPRLYAIAASAAATRGHLDEAEDLARAADAVSGGRSGYGVEILARLELFRGQLDAAREHSRAAVARHRAQGDELAAVTAATSGVLALAFGGRPAEARQAADVLLVQAADVGSLSALAMCEYCAAEAVMDDVDRARAHLSRSVALARSVGADFVEGLAITTLAGLDVRSDPPAASFARLRDSLDHWERAGMWKQQWWLTLRMLVESLSATGHHVPVAVLVSSFEASATTGPVYGADADRLAAAVQLATATLDPEELVAATSAGARLGDEAALAYGRRVLDEIIAGVSEAASAMP